MSSSELSLADIADGAEARVVSMPAGDPSLSRLKEMGLLPKSKVSIIRRNILGDPLEISIRSGLFSIRKSDAEKIKVELIES